jgi:predicted regulator of Ras-like GTPase activity (Roadblock/LC7/MglB family)
MNLLPNLRNRVETIRMFAFLKTIFRGRTAARQSAGGLAIPRTVYTPGDRPASPRRRVQTPRATPKPAPAPVPEATSPVPETSSNDALGSDVDIPLQSVLKGLPDDLKDRVRDLDIRGATMTISLERILAQLPSGAVKISFGSLRNAAPQLFSAGADCDSRDVALPLDEILAKVNPAMICPPPEPVTSGSTETREKSSDTDTFVPPHPTGDAAPSRGSTLSVPPAAAPGQALDETPLVPATPPAGSAVPAAAPRTSPIRVPTPQVAKPAEKGASIEVDLTSLIERWSPDLRMEIAQWNLPAPKVALPVETVREGLKRGRVAFPWKTFRSWITPAPPAGDSAHDNATVELPLPVITPVFLTGPKPAAKSSQKTAIDEIPDLFFDGRKAEGSISNDENREVSAVPPGALQVLKESSAVAETRPVAAAEPTTAAVEAPVAQPKDAGVIRIPLNDLIQSWPEDIRTEIGHWNLPQLMVSFPAGQIDAALKQGKAVFPWKTLRSWIAPTPPSAKSAHDKAMLELPLQVILPFFLAGRKQPARLQPQIPDDIPDPFADFLPNPSAAATAPATEITAPAPKVKPSDAKSNGKPSGAPTAIDKSTKSKSSKRKPSPAPSKPQVEAKASGGNESATEAEPKPQKIPAPSNRSSTPVEVLASAVGLEGVAGALVALSDGFKVASKLPPDLDGDTLAAFLPHIFSKVDQSTRELRMGDLNSLNFTVDDIPWKIFRVDQIFFAALGHAGQPMPTEQLAALAHKLTFKN